MSQPRQRQRESDNDDDQIVRREDGSENLLEWQPYYSAAAARRDVVSELRRLEEMQHGAVNHLAETMQEALRIQRSSELESETTRSHKYGAVKIDGRAKILLGNSYGGTTISDNTDILLGDLHEYRSHVYSPRLDRRILQVQNELLSQQSIVENSLSLLIKEAGLEWTGPTEDEKLETFIGRPENVKEIKELLQDSFFPFMRLMESIDACLQAVGSCIMTVTDSSYTAPGSWSILVEGIRSQAGRRKFDQTTSFSGQPESGRNDMNNDLPRGAERERTVRRILANLHTTNTKFGMLVLKAEKLTEISSTTGSINDDSVSTSSRESEEGEPTALFLSVMVRERERSPREELVEALLDTGASADCMSDDLRKKLNLVMEPHQEFICTAAQEQGLNSIGTVKVILKWQDRLRIFRQETRGKRKLHVVPGLILPLILSHDFTNTYADTGIWDVCSKADSIFEHRVAAPFGPGRIKSAEIEAELEAQRKKRERNRQKEQMERDKKNAEMAAWVNTTAPVDDGQSQTSTVSQQTTRTSSTTNTHGS